MSDDWQDIMEEFARRQAEARAMGGDEKLSKQRKDGRNDARARIDKLVDEGSFQELGTLVGALSHEGFPGTPADALVGGLAMIDGRPVVVASEDFTVAGGSIGFGNHAKRLRMASIALQEKIPFLIMLDGAGERVTNGMQRHPYAPNDLQILAKLKGQVPTVALVMGPSAGHGALSGLLLDFVIMVEGSALFAAGPPVVAEALGQQVDKEELGGAALHTQISGVAHNRVESEEEAFAAARSYLSFFGDGSREGDTGPRTLDNILDQIPRDQRKIYDIKPVIHDLVDADSFFEIQPDFAANMITGLAQLGGQSIGLIANQPKIKAGAIDRQAAQKAARFMELADNFDLPVIFLTDNPGVQPGPAAEKDGTLQAAAEMYLAQSRLTSPKLHVTLRKAYGFGSSIMAMNPFDGQTVTYAFPGISLGALPTRGGGEAAKLDDETRAKLAALEEKAAWGAGDSMAYDEIIDPRELRNALLTGLKASRQRDAL